MSSSDASSGGNSFLFRVYLSTSLMQTAQFLAENAAECERGAGIEPKERASACLSNVIGSVLSSVSYLEARINEIISDLAEDPPHLEAAGLSEKSAFALNRLVASSLLQRAKLSSLDKYDLVLATLERDPFNRGEAPYQDVKLLVTLRNAIVHFEPEWLPAWSGQLPQEEQHRFERALKGRFEESPFYSSSQPYFPRRCLSAGCAKWAIDSAWAFSRAFAVKIGIDPDHLPMSAGRFPTS